MTNSWDITLTPTSASVLFQIRRSPPSEIVNIRTLFINRPASTGESIEVLLGFDTFGSRLQSAAKIETTNSETEGVVLVGECNLEGDLGEVLYVNSIKANLNTGNVNGPITCLGIPKIPGAANVHEINLRSTSGSLRGNVTFVPKVTSPVFLGRISKLDFPNGDIGLFADPPSPMPNPIEIRADRFIGSVSARRINAVLAGTNVNPAVPDFDSFVEEFGKLDTGFAGGSGEFFGEIRAKSMNVSVFQPEDSLARWDFRGPVYGRIWLQDIHNSGGGDANRIVMPVNGLKTTIALSTPTPGSPSSIVWQGPVIIGTTTLDPHPVSPPPTAVEYPNLAGSLGGGAVGLVPFALHRTDCVPVHDTFINDMSARPGPNNPIRMRHYGLVNWDTMGTLKPFKIERRKIGSVVAWTDPTAGGTCFDNQVLDSNNKTIVIITPTRTLQRGFEYRISPRLDGNGRTVLRSDVPHRSVADDFDVSTLSPLTFKICDSMPAGAPGDANDNGTIEFDDITQVLANFDNTVCLRLGDADRNGVVNFADVTEVLAFFMSGNMYCVSAGQSIDADGDGLATMALDSDSLAASVANLFDALASMGYGSIEAFTDAIAQMDEEARNAEVSWLRRLLEGTP